MLAHPQPKEETGRKRPGKKKRGSGRSSFSGVKRKWLAAQRMLLLLFSSYINI